MPTLSDPKTYAEDQRDMIRKACFEIRAELGAWETRERDAATFSSKKITRMEIAAHNSRLYGMELLLAVMLGSNVSMPWQRDLPLSLTKNADKPLTMKAGSIGASCYWCELNRPIPSGRGRPAEHFFAREERASECCAARECIFRALEFVFTGRKR